jgi:hypothetical protein
LALAAVLLLAFFVWLAFEIFYATLIANWILVSEHNYPRVHKLLEEVQETIGVKERVDIIVYEQGQFNAYFSMLFARRAIFMNSELLEQGVTDDELRWVIARFVGRIRAKRRIGPLRWAIALTERLGLFNLFIFPYERATAYTGDRVALAVINGDISTAISAMNKLIVGRQLGYSVNPAGIVIQYKRVKGSLFAFLGRLFSPLPAATARYFDLIAFAAERYPNEYAKFAAMNPSFQTVGGAWRLLNTAQLPSYAGQGLSSGAVGGLLFGGAAILGVVAVVTISTHGGFRLPALPASYQSTMAATGAPADHTYAPPSSYETPAAAPAPDYSTYNAPTPVSYSTFGAYAISDSTLSWGAAWNGATRESAESAARDQCGAHASDCKAVIYFQNACGALAIDANQRAWGADWGATLAEARANALEACAQYGASCRIQNAVCSSQ